MLSNCQGLFSGGLLLCNAFHGAAGYNHWWTPTSITEEVRHACDKTCTVIYVKYATWENGCVPVCWRGLGAIDFRT